MNPNQRLTRRQVLATAGTTAAVLAPGAEALKNSFGSAAAWEDDFRKTAASLYGGSGWTVLAWNQHTRELHNYWASDHSQSAVMGTPLLVLDLYEHAYHMDFGAAAARYVDAFFVNVQWDEVQRRVDGATKR